MTQASSSSTTGRKNILWPNAQKDAIIDFLVEHPYYERSVHGSKFKRYLEPLIIPGKTPDQIVAQAIYLLGRAEQVHKNLSSTGQGNVPGQIRGAKGSYGFERLKDLIEIRRLPEQPGADFRAPGPVSQSEAAVPVGGEPDDPDEPEIILEERSPPASPLAPPTPMLLPGPVSPPAPHTPLVPPATVAPPLVSPAPVSNSRGGRRLNVNREPRRSGQPASVMAELRHLQEENIQRLAARTEALNAKVIIGKENLELKDRIRLDNVEQKERDRELKRAIHVQNMDLELKRIVEKGRDRDLEREVQLKRLEMERELELKRMDLEREMAIKKLEIERELGLKKLEMEREMQNKEARQ